MAVGDVPRGRWRPGRLGRVLGLLAVAIVVIVAGLGIGAYLQGREATLTVVTYESLLGGCGSPNLTAVIQGFEATHAVRVAVDCVSGTLSSLLIREKGSPGIDLAIGLDEITGPAADAAGTLVPYEAPAAADLPAGLQAEIAPDHSVTPYEYGYLGIDYTPAVGTPTHGAARNVSLPEIAGNASWASRLLVEDPMSSIVGEEFLLSEIAFYESVLHANWTTFWEGADPGLHFSDDWSDAYAQFTNGPDAPPMLLSYSTDPAAAIVGSTPSFNATLYHWNGTTYAWRTIYGIGIVRGSTHIALDQQFIDYFLSAPVQNRIPLNEWVYPVNASVPLPSSFAWAADPTNATVLNDAIPPASIPGQLSGWLDAWQTIYNARGP